MIRSTKGIVLKSTKYGETSLIVKIFTREMGLQSYIINGVRKSTGKKKASLFIPLTLLDLEVYHKENSQIKRIKEHRNYFIYRQIPFDIIRSTISIYISEILYKSIRSEQPQPELYDSIEAELVRLDEDSRDHLALFPIFFMFTLSECMGFGPLDNYSEDCAIFDLEEGSYRPDYPSHMNFIDDNLSGPFCLLIRGLKDHKIVQTLSKKDRNVLLNHLQDYFRLHLEGFKEVNALKILQEVLS